jgi:hypothetical protein
MCNVVIKGGPDENVYLMKKKMSSCTGVVYFVLHNGLSVDKRELAKYKQYGLIFSNQVKYK